MDQLEQDILDAIDAHRDEIIQYGNHIFNHPELGYKEFNTSQFIKEAFQTLKIPYTENHGITGVKGRLRGKQNKVTLCIMGEMDAVVCPEHPQADKVTGAAHSCGHHGQIASMLGAAIGLSAVSKHLFGDVVFFAVPAEEYVEIEYREQLIKSGAIKYMGGKQELISNGDFDDIDMAVMIHGLSSEKKGITIPTGGLGFIGKNIQFIGKEAHAASPSEGINALNAAIASMMCIHSIRDTFNDKDSVRIHPILTKGGDLVNVVPADVRMETYVRSGNIASMIKANQAVNRAIKGATYAVGADVSIQDYPGYLPLSQNSEMSACFEKVVTRYLGAESLLPPSNFGGSTDAGDLGYLIPVLHPCSAGFSGISHSKHYSVSDEEWAYIIPAKLMALFALDLLSNNCEKALHIKENFPYQSRQQYMDSWEKILSDQEKASSNNIINT